MIGRRTLLVLSVLLSAGVHAGLLALAPHVVFSNLNLPDEFRKPVKVAFTRDITSLPAGPAAAGETRPPAKSAPRKIEIADELAGIGKEPAPTLDSVLNQPVEIPGLPERIAQENLARAYAFEPDPDTLQSIETRIVEIAQEAARSNIDIPRRLVAPSVDRILPEDEYPALRGPSDTPVESGLSFGSLPTVSLLGEPAAAPAHAETPENPPEAPLEAAPAPALPAMEKAALPEVNLAPVVKEIAQEKPYEFIDDMLDVALETYLPPKERYGYFKLHVAPRKDSRIPILPKDVTFVIDASNSIVQHKLDATVKATRQMIRQLRNDDCFNIIIFRDSPVLFMEHPVQAADATKEAALDFLSDLRSRGVTDVYKAVRQVIGAPARPGVPGIIVFMSDGRPTAGVRDARAIINALSDENTAGNNVVAYGGGNTVNRYLLDLLAYRNKGESYVSQSIESIETDLPAFFAKFNNPLLVKINANFGRVKDKEIYPRELPDFYAGRGITVYGRFDTKADSQFLMRLHGRAGQKDKEVIFKQDLRKAAPGAEIIARHWAFQKVYHLIDRICSEGEKPELLAEIRELSRAYGIKTSYDE